VTGLVDPEETGRALAERLGRPVRSFSVAISVEAMALAWARQEGAPKGAVVVSDREVSPLGRLGKLWSGRAEDTLACAVVLRPALPAAQADAVWLAAGLGATEGVGTLGRSARLGIWWPDGIVDVDSAEEVGQLKAEVQLAPSQVRVAVVTIRLNLERLGVELADRDDLLESVLGSLDQRAAGLDEGGAALVVPYDKRCALLGRRVRVLLRPRGETRGVARGVDDGARLEVASSTGMVERVSVDMLRSLEVVEG